MEKLIHKTIFKGRYLIILPFIIAIPMITGCPLGSHNTPDIAKVQALSTLATVEYRLTKIVKSSKSSFWGTKKILFQVNAAMKAGLDLSDINEQDVSITKESITVQLPKPKIVSLQIKPEDVILKYKEHSALVSDFNENQVNEILKLGETDIRKTIENDTDLIKTAGENAKVFIETLLHNMDPKKKITVKFKDK